ncbi:MAG: OmpA family protein [Burkholderiales bacterium]|uniref:OmpA family protein n=1 Tax=Inhella sp. TaxID=1921806 RepID=UPI001ACE7C25|nr:OmpA family protein [Burkholderiales bacterium]
MKSVPHALTQGLRTATLWAALCMASLPAAAQSSEPVLKGKEVTSEALIDALALPAPTAPRTRGLRPVAPDAAKPAGSAQGGKANLLITFLTNSTQLTTEAEEIVATLAKAMQSEQLASVRFRVEGHADARGDVAANLALSKARAEAVAARLSSKHGVAAERLQPEGKGSAEPLNKERVDAPENRRVTVVSLR